MSTLLETENLSIAFGGITAVDQVSLAVAPGQIHSIIGPNGAGKTTLFNLVSGLYLPSAGRVRLAGEDVTGLAPEQLARRGLSRSFQNLQIFFRMSAVENVMVGCHRHERTGILSHLLALPNVRAENRNSREIAMAQLARVGLADLAEKEAGSLSYGALKRLEIARALATEPRILLLDEPAAGCNAVETEEIDRVIHDVAKAGIAILLVEHDMRLVMRISDEITVLERGRKLVSGKPDTVRNDPRVIAAYLGTFGSEEANRA
ncbi:MAG: ABC transporter ATP-binding protein [Beijerinckiaceae bacterium]|jgi:branched-chain amino acid transport system ATP-binding protein|nr:ABC transporter ATP-binding protein [Beijerinckiaceae bacterium]